MPLTFHLPVVLDLLLGIPLSYLIVQLNKRLLYNIGYDKYVQFPPGNLAHPILFVLINAILVLHWSRQLHFEAKTIAKTIHEKEIRTSQEIEKWNKFITHLEDEKERIERILGLEAKVQILTESLAAIDPGMRQDQTDEDLEVAVDGRFDLPVPAHLLHHDVGQGASPGFPIPPLLKQIKTVPSTTPKAPAEKERDAAEEQKSKVPFAKTTISRHRGASIVSSLLAQPINTDELGDVREGSVVNAKRRNKYKARKSVLPVSESDYAGDADVDDSAREGRGKGKARTRRTKGEEGYLLREDTQGGSWRDVKVAERSGE